MLTGRGAHRGQSANGGAWAECAPQLAGAPALVPQVWACLAQLGFDNVEPLLAPREAAALAAVRDYARLRQGEVWAAVRAAFEREGVVPSDEDR